MESREFNLQSLQQNQDIDNQGQESPIKIDLNVEDSPYQYQDYVQQQQQVSSISSSPQTTKSRSPYIAGFYGIDNVIQEVASEEENTTSEFISNDSLASINIGLEIKAEVLLQEKGQYDVFKVYKCIKLQHFQKNQIICNYGEVGDLFYIVFKGKVGVKVPTNQNLSFGNYFEILKFVTDNYYQIVKQKDNHTKIIKKFIDVVGYDKIVTTSFQSIEDLIAFIDNEIFQSQARSPNRRANQKIYQDTQRLQFIQEFKKQLEIQQKQNKPLNFNVEISILKEVVQLGEGQSFGELALITDKPRAATVYAKDPHVILATLGKKDYQNIIGDSFKQKIDKAIEIIQQFEIFKVLTQRRLTNIYYFLQEKIYHRNQFLYQEGDSVDGLFLIINGQMKRLKRDERLKSMILSLVQGQEIIGLEEIILNQSVRQHTLQVTSEQVFAFFMSARDLQDRILHLYPELFKKLKDQYIARSTFYNQRQEVITEHQLEQEGEAFRIHNKLNIDKMYQSIQPTQELTLLQTEEQQKRVAFQRSGMTQEQIDMIMKSYNQERIDKLKKYQEFKQKRRQPRQQKLNLIEKEVLPLRKKSLSPLILSSRNKTPMSVTPRMRGDHASSTSSLSTKGKRNEVELIKNFGLKRSFQGEGKRCSLEKITDRLQEEVEKQCSEMRCDRERKEILIYLKKYKQDLKLTDKEKELLDESQLVDLDDFQRQEYLKMLKQKILQESEEKKQSRNNIIKLKYPTQSPEIDNFKQIWNNFKTNRYDKKKYVYQTNCISEQSTINDQNQKESTPKSQEKQEEQTKSSHSKFMQKLQQSNKVLEKHYISTPKVHVIRQPKTQDNAQTQNPQKMNIQSPADDTFHLLQLVNEQKESQENSYNLLDPRFPNENQDKQLIAIPTKEHQLDLIMNKHTSSSKGFKGIKSKKKKLRNLLLLAMNSPSNPIIQNTEFLRSYVQTNNQSPKMSGNIRRQSITTKITPKGNNSKFRLSKGFSTSGFKTTRESKSTLEVFGEQEGDKILLSDLNPSNGRHSARNQRSQISIKQSAVQPILSQKAYEKIYSIKKLNALVPYSKIQNSQQQLKKKKSLKKLQSAKSENLLSVKHDK